MDYPLFYIQEFKRYISLQTSSVNTIKNYLSDLRLFFSFAAKKSGQSVSPQTLPDFITDDFINQYESFLTLTNPPATTKRRVSSLKKFIDYCRTQSIFPTMPRTAPPVVPPPLPPVFPIASAPEVISAVPIAPPIQAPPPLPPVTAPLPPTPPIPVAPAPQPPPPPISPLPYSFSDTPPDFEPEPVNIVPEIPELPTYPIAPETESLVHSLDAVFSDTPTSTIPEYDSEPIDHRPAVSRRQKKSLPEFVTYILVSVVSFAICLGLTLLVTLVFLS